MPTRTQRVENRLTLRHSNDVAIGPNMTRNYSHTCKELSLRVGRSSRKVSKLTNATAESLLEGAHVNGALDVVNERIKVGHGKLEGGGGASAALGGRDFAEVGCKPGSCDCSHYRDDVERRHKLRFDVASQRIFGHHQPSASDQVPGALRATASTVQRLLKRNNEVLVVREGACPTRRGNRERPIRHDREACDLTVVIPCQFHLRGMNDDARDLGNANCSLAAPLLALDEQPRPIAQAKVDVFKSFRTNGRHDRKLALARSSACKKECCETHLIGDAGDVGRSTAEAGEDVVDGWKGLL